MEEYQKLRIIIDPNARGVDRTAEISEAVKRVFASVNGFYEIRVTRPNDDASTLAKEARYKDYSGVVVCGGDEVVREASLSLVGSSTALGIVPIGYRNTIAESFGISRNIDKALGRIKPQNLNAIDVGRIADRYFFVSAGLGFDVELSGFTDIGSSTEAKASIVTYLSKLLIDFRKFNPIPLVIKVDEKTLIASPLLARFALEDMGKASTASSKGKTRIDLKIVPQIKFSEAARKMKRLLQGAFDSIEGIKNVSASGTFEVERTNSGLLHADGESFLAGTKFEVSLLTNALKVWQGSLPGSPHTKAV
jgi:diacylglycerol kinase family enzyme